MNHVAKHPRSIDDPQISAKKDAGVKTGRASKAGSSMRPAKSAASGDVAKVGRVKADSDALKRRTSGSVKNATPDGSFGVKFVGAEAQTGRVTQRTRAVKFGVALTDAKVAVSGARVAAGNGRVKVSGVVVVRGTVLPVNASTGRITDSTPATVVRRVIGRAVSSKERAREYLVRLGTLTQSGNVTRKYGGR